MTATITGAPPRWASPNLYDESFGPDLCDFADTYCVVTSESIAAKVGEPLRLRAWQRELFNDLLEVRPDGRLRHRTALIGLPKKNGKSLLGSVLALWALVYGPDNGLIIGCASTRAQARIVFDETRRMALANPTLTETLDIQKNLIENRSNGSIYRVVSAEAGGADGINPTLVIFDEVHRQPNDDLWQVATQGIITRPSAMVVGITTAGHDRQSLEYRLYEHGVKVAKGEIDDPSFFMRWWEPADPDCDYRDPKVWAECSPGLDDFQDREDFAAIVAREPENEVRRFRLNQHTKTYSAWLKFGAWEACAQPGSIPKGAEVTLGLDGSWSSDTTALVACSIDKLHLEPIDAWEKDPENPEWRVPVAEVQEAVRQARARWNVRELVADPTGWKETLQRLADEGLLVNEFPQSSDVRMTAATKTFEDCVYERRLSHNGDPRLADHVGNAITKPAAYSDGHRIVKKYRGSPRKIDMAMAALFALDRAVFYQTGAPDPTVMWLDDDPEDWDDE